MRRFTPLFLMLFSGCLALSGRCLYETRTVSVKENASDVTIDMVESEQRDYQPDKDMSWEIRGPTLKGDVTEITLRDATNRVVYTFPIQSAAIETLSNGFVRQSEGSDINGFFDLLSSRKATVVIVTGTHGTITIPLQNVTSSDWNRPYCS
jgi:hypothetical protein